MKADLENNIYEEFLMPMENTTLMQRKQDIQPHMYTDIVMYTYF